MAFKYCRAYSWSDRKDSLSIARSFYKKAASSAKELELPCNIAVFLAHEHEEFPFVSIAIDMDYGVVENSETSRILDRFVERLGEPQPGVFENPGWFDSVDEDYNTTLELHGVTLHEGVFLERKVKAFDDHSIREEWKTLHEQCLAEVEKLQPNADALTLLNLAIAKSTNIIRERHGLSKDRMLIIMEGKEVNNRSESESTASEMEN